MRLSFRLLSFLAVLAVPAAFLPSVALAKEEGGVTITRVLAGWRDAASFKRISEYFTGHENPSGTTIRRTHPNERGGFYFLVRAANPGAAVTVTINLEVVTPTDTTPEAYTFTAELKSGANLLNLGLTAGDWPDPKANPVAWKVDLFSADGTLLASEKSYLWERPTGK